MSDDPEQPPPWPPYGQVPSSGQHGPYGAPAHGAPAFGAVAAPTPTSATTSLVLGIASLVCLGFLAGIPAMIIARRATGEIDAANGALGGRGVATAGFVTGLIGTLFSIVAIVALVGLLALGSSVQNQYQTTCDQIGTSDDPDPCR